MIVVFLMRKSVVTVPCLYYDEHFRNCEAVTLEIIPKQYRPARLKPNQHISKSHKFRKWFVKSGYSSLLDKLRVVECNESIWRGSLSI